MDLADYVRALRRRWLLMLACLVASLGTSIGLTVTATPTYESQARLFIASTQTTTTEALQGAQLSAARITSYAEMIQTLELARAVARNLGLDEDPEVLRNHVSAEVLEETFIIEVGATNTDPDRAEALAQGFAVGLADMIEDLEISSVGDEEFIRASVYQAAVPPGPPTSPRPVRNVALGLLIGLVVAASAAVIRELLDSTVRSGADLGKVTTVPILGDVPFDTAARVRDFGDSLDLSAPGMEAYRVLRTNLQFVDVDRHAKVLVVTSSVPNEGKTTTAVNLAIAHAQAGQRVLLIEADLRRPRASAALGLDQGVGLTTVLIGKVSLEDATQVHANGNLHVLSSGALPPNPAELLQSRAMADLVHSLRGQYNVVIIDAPPLLPVADATVLSAISDGAIIVVRHGRTRRDQVVASSSRLAQVDAHAVGIVINMTPSRLMGYGYGYGYGQTGERKGRRQARRQSRPSGV